MSEVSDVIKSKPRVPGTKGDARRLRASGWVPAIAYGAVEPVSLAVDPKTMTTARFSFGASHVYTLDVDGGESLKVLFKDAQQDSLTHKPLHVDFYVVDDAKPVTVAVKVLVKGRAQGVVEGGKLDQVKRDVRLKGLPGKLVDTITIDVTELGAGQRYRASDLSLPEGLELAGSPKDVLVAITMPKGKKAAADKAED